MSIPKDTPPGRDDRHARPSALCKSLGQIAAETSAGEQLTPQKLLDIAHSRGLPVCVAVPDNSIVVLSDWSEARRAARAPQLDARVREMLPSAPVYVCPEIELLQLPEAAIKTLLGTKGGLPITQFDRGYARSHGSSEWQPDHARPVVPPDGSPILFPAFLVYPRDMIQETDVRPGQKLGFRPFQRLADIGRPQEVFVYPERLLVFPADLDRLRQALLERPSDASDEGPHVSQMMKDLMATWHREWFSRDASEIRSLNWKARVERALKDLDSGRKDKGGRPLWSPDLLSLAPHLIKPDDFETVKANGRKQRDQGQISRRFRRLKEVAKLLWGSKTSDDPDVASADVIFELDFLGSDRQKKNAAAILRPWPSRRGGRR